MTTATVQPHYQLWFSPRKPRPGAADRKTIVISAPSKIEAVHVGRQIAENNPVWVFEKAERTTEAGAPPAPLMGPPR